MRYLGIDYGEKRIGVALSDERARFAFAHSVVLNAGHKKVIKEIKKICDENQVGKIVLGKSLDYKGQPNPIMEKIEQFKKELEIAIKLPVMYENESLTTIEAGRSLKGERTRPPVQRGIKHTEKHFKMKRKIDASAAALILRGYLDKNMLK